MRVYLSVTGDFDPDDFTARVGLSPSQTWRRGERSARDPQLAGRTVPVCDHWAFGLTERPEFDLELLVDELLTLAEKGLSALGQAVADLGLNLEVTVVVKWDPATTASPALHLRGRHLALLGSLGAEVDIDLFADC
nr:DUF4279 domain-containing protein [Deinococcus arboris]